MSSSLLPDDVRILQQSVAQLSRQNEQLKEALMKQQQALSSKVEEKSAGNETLDAIAARPRPKFFETPDLKSGEYKTILYRVDVEEAVAYITLNRPSHLNAIVWPMPYEIRHAVQRANDDDAVRCIVLAGAGAGFCSGYDLKVYAESERGTVAGSQKTPYCPYIDYVEMKECTDCYMSLFHSLKPTIAAVHGWAVAGGSDIALCCDMVVMAENARIGYPPARMWGSPTTHMWTTRIGGERAKRMLLTGDLVDGVEAARMGLVLRAVPHAELEASVRQLTRRMKGIPQNQLFFNKLICNMVIEGSNLSNTQKVATMLDGMTRHSPEGVAFQRMAQEQGFQKAIELLRSDPNTGRKRAASENAPRSKL